jgi:hypothetical protein
MVAAAFYAGRRRINKVIPVCGGFGWILVAGVDNFDLACSESLD